MAESTLKLKIVTQERAVLEQEVRSVTATTTTGEVTILPGHIPLFSTLATGELHFFAPGKDQPEIFAVSGGFLDVGPDNTVTILADFARHSDEINEAEAEAARDRAEQAMKEKGDAISSREFQLAESEFLQAINELKIVHKRRGGLS